MTRGMTRRRSATNKPDAMKPTRRGRSTTPNNLPYHTNNHIQERQVAAVLDYPHYLVANYNYYHSKAPRNASHISARGGTTTTSHHRKAQNSKTKRAPKEVQKNWRTRIK